MQVKIYCTGYNNVRVKVSHLLGGFPDTRKNTATDQDEWPSIIENFRVAQNHIEDFHVVEESIDKFYGFAGEYYGELTEEVVDRWWDLDCPDLFRLKPNKENETNGWGLNLLAWENKMLEVNFKDTYVLDMTEEERNKLTKGQNNWVTKEIKNYFKADELDEEVIEEYEKEVRLYEKAIQNLFDRFKPEVIEEFEGDEFEVLDDGRIKAKMYKLDCGFLNIYTRNEKVSEMKQVLSNRDHSKWLDVTLPIAPQSITIKRKIFNFLADKVEEEIGEKLYCTTMLD